MRTCLFLFIASASAARSSTGENPVAKVVRLLRDMQDQLNSERKADEAQYDKLQCWCKSNGGGKQAAVEVATQRLSDLDSSIKAMSAKASELDQSITQLNQEYAENREALDTATEMRSKDKAQFHADDKDMTLSIGSLKNAVTVLSKNIGFLQAPESFLSVKTTVRRMLKTTPDDLLKQILNPDARESLGTFVQGGVQSPQGGEIMGILKQMHENFETNLAEATSDEAKASSEFASLKDAKTDELNAGEQLAKEKTAQLAKTKQALAQAKEDQEDTNNAMSADQEFLVDLKRRCAAADADWEERSKTRALEIAAVGEAVGILTEDDARDMTSKTLSFLQLASKRRVVSKGQLAREQASRILLNQARKSGNIALAQVAVHVQTDAFAKVREAVSKQIEDLDNENADEVKHKDYCKAEFHKNDMEQIKAKRSIKDLTTSVDELESSITSLADDISSLRAELAQMQIDMQRANQNRVAENKEFQTTIADQRATQAILKKALDRLSGFYKEQFLQMSATKQEPGAPVEAMPESMGEYKSKSGAGAVMTMIGSIIQDAKDMEKEATQSEQDAQEAYEEFLKTSDASTREAQRSLTNKAENKAKAESTKFTAEADKKDAEADLEGLAQFAAELHSSCDFVMANFEARQETRAAEMDGLKSALQALSN